VWGLKGQESWTSGKAMKEMEGEREREREIEATLWEREGQTGIEVSTNRPTG
jgi:hypothetical protein